MSAVVRRHHARRAGRAPLSIGVVLAGSLAWLGVTAGSDWPGAYLMVWALFLVGVVPLLRAQAAGRLDLLEPITGINVLYVVYFGVAAVYELNTPFKEGRLNVAIEEGIHVGLTYAIGALLALQAGYALARRYIPAAGPVEEVPPERWSRVFWVSALVYAIGLAARIHGVTSGLHIRFAAADIYGQYSGLDILWDYLGFFSTFGFLLMVALAFVVPAWPSPRILASLMLPVELFFAFLGGPKEYFIPLLVGPVICYYYARRAPTASRLLAAAAAMALVVFPVMTSYRSLDPAYLRKASLADSVAYAIGGVGDAIVEKGVLGYLAWSLELVVERLDGIYTLTGVLMNVPQTMDYQWGKTILVGFAMLVPTFIWTTKYDYLQTVITWGERIFGVPAGTSGISITHPGEFFLNFGTIGMVAGMLLLGAALQLIHRGLVGRRRFFGIVIYAVLWPVLVIPEYPLAAYYSNAAKQAGLLFLVSLAAGVRWRPKRAGA